MNTEKKLHISVERCKSCGQCIATCPKKALQIGKVLNQQGYNVVELIKPNNCILCGMCRIVCPDVCIAVISNTK